MQEKKKKKANRNISPTAAATQPHPQLLPAQLIPVVFSGTLLARQHLNQQEACSAPQLQEPHHKHNRPDLTCLEVNSRATRPAAAFSAARIPPHNLLGQAICSVRRLLALAPAPARLKEQRAVAWVAALFSAGVRLRLKLKQSHRFQDSVDLVRDYQEQVRGACCK